MSAVALLLAPPAHFAPLAPAAARQPGAAGGGGGGGNASVDLLGLREPVPLPPAAASHRMQQALLQQVLDVSQSSVALLLSSSLPGFSLASTLRFSSRRHGTVCTRGACSCALTTPVCACGAAGHRAAQGRGQRRGASSSGQGRHAGGVHPRNYGLCTLQVRARTASTSSSPRLTPLLPAQLTSTMHTPAALLALACLTHHPADSLLCSSQGVGDWRAADARRQELHLPTAGPGGAGGGRLWHGAAGGGQHRGAGAASAGRPSAGACSKRASLSLSLSSSSSPCTKSLLHMSA